MAIAAEEKEAGVPEWVVTFGDMMSLLLTFFIMLFSMSEIKEEQKYQAMMEALRKRFGYEASFLSMIPGDVRPRNSALAKLASLGRSRRADVMRGGDKVRAPVGENPRVQAIRMAEHITVGGVVLFNKGAWKLTPEQERDFEAIARVIAGKPQKIEIRGHTCSDPLPKDSPYKTHWDLAYARCSQARKCLVKLGIDPKRIRLAVAADTEPKTIRNDPLLQRENDRVVISMLNELVRDLEGAKGEEQEKFSNEGAP